MGKPITQPSALIALSGGVDSSAAALIAQKAGYRCVGATMRLNDCDGACEEAARVAEFLGMEFHAFDFRERFKNSVITPFVRSYERGETPNPCVDCNRELKFGALLEQALRLGCDKIVTGHYAQVEWDNLAGRYLLKKAANIQKDQSYCLYCLTQEVLERVMFPLGEYAHKDEIRRLAEEYALPTAQKRDSQDICFIPNGDYAQFVREYTGKEYAEGDFISGNGFVLGRHGGIIGYTVGQRKGLGISWSEPLYVLSKNAAANTVTLGTERELLCDSVTARDFNWIALETPPSQPITVMARTRCHGEETPAEARANSDGTVTVTFKQPQRRTAPGQAVVLYDEDIVLGGGVAL